jgi:hypothetical protein
MAQSQFKIKAQRKENMKKDKRLFFTIGGLLCVLGLGVACLTLFRPIPYWLVKFRWQPALEADVERAANLVRNHANKAIESLKSTKLEEWGDKKHQLEANEIKAEMKRAKELAKHCEEARSEAFVINMGIAVTFLAAGLIIQRKGMTRKAKTI